MTGNMSAIDGWRCALTDMSFEATRPISTASSKSTATPSSNSGATEQKKPKKKRKRPVNLQSDYQYQYHQTSNDYDLPGPSSNLTVVQQNLDWIGDYPVVEPDIATNSSSVFNPFHSFHPPALPAIPVQRPPAQPSKQSALGQCLEGEIIPDLYVDTDILEAFLSDPEHSRESRRRIERAAIPDIVYYWRERGGVRTKEETVKNVLLQNYNVGPFDVMASSIYTYGFPPHLCNGSSYFFVAFRIAKFFGIKIDYSSDSAKLPKETGNLNLYRCVINVRDDPRNFFEGFGLKTKDARQRASYRFLKALEHDSRTPILFCTKSDIPMPDDTLINTVNCSLFDYVRGHARGPIEPEEPVDRYVYFNDVISNLAALNLAPIQLDEKQNEVTQLHSCTIDVHNPDGEILCSVGKPSCHSLDPNAILGHGRDKYAAREMAGRTMVSMLWCKYPS